MLEGLAGLPISIDTSKARVAREALELGAELVNDVIGAARGPGHGRGDRRRRRVRVSHAHAGLPTDDAGRSFTTTTSWAMCWPSWSERLAFAVENGVREERICVDPGIGFGKTPDQNLELLRRLDELRSLGRPVLVGVSRKSTLGKVLGDASATQAGVAASVAAAVAAFDRGATMIRAHDVGETVEALAVAAAVERGKITA